MTFNILLRTVLVLTLSGNAVIAWGQSGPVLATVNGSKIYASQVNEMVSMAVSNGAKESPELRQNILNDLIVREAIAQDTKKTGLLNKDNNALRLKLAQQNAILELWLAEYLRDRPVTEADVRAEYDRQAVLSKEPQNAKQYEVAQIMVATEAEASAMIKQINAGAKFENLATKHSLEKISGAQGGVVGWVFPYQLAPPINEIVTNLGKGKINQTPVKTGNGWHVIKVDNVRPFVLPAFDQVRNALAQELVQQRRQEAINSLLKDAKVLRGNQ
jgi:peptidyl-prolyl cis-trans isomerase C